MIKKALSQLIIAIVFISIYGLFIAAPITLAQEPDYDRINDVARQMNCPTCVGINLADCRTQTCEQWREQIGDLIQEGYSDQEILDYFSTRYGNRVLLEPPKSGSTLFLWIIPVVAVIVGGGWLFYMIRRWNRAEPAPVIPTPQAKSTPKADVDDYVSIVEKDLEG